MQQAQQQQFSSTKLQRALELADTAAKTGLDMSVVEPSKPMPSPTLDNYQEQKRELILNIARELLCKDALALSMKYGTSLVAQASEIAKTLKPTREQALMRYRRQEQENQRELWKALREAGAEPCQHSRKDYVQVIYTQLEFQSRGENPPIERVLAAAFPDNEKKAKSIGNSTRKSRWNEAYLSDSVRDHHVQKAILCIHGARSVQLRLSARTFRNSLGINRNLYQSCDRITRLEREVDLLAARVKLLEQQMQCTKLREVLADAGCTSSKEKVLALYAEGKRQTAIAEALGMNIDSVKSILRRSRQSPR